MSSIFDCSVDSELLSGMRLARAAIGRGELVVIPTDTVYGVAADAFNAEAVQRLIDAKGRDRTSPPPVLIPNQATIDGLARDVPVAVRHLVLEFWPGGLTIVLPAQPSLQWDLGDTNGTVALRMPSDPIALELLAETGPLAVSSANLTGHPAATSAHEAEAMLGDSIQVYLDNGAAGLGYADAEVTESSSTIVDATALALGTGKLRILRHGVISEARLREVVGDELEGGDDEQPTGDHDEQSAEESAAIVDAAPAPATEPRDTDEISADFDADAAQPTTGKHAAIVVPDSGSDFDADSGSDPDSDSDSDPTSPRAEDPPAAPERPSAP